jgi:mannan endo-1,4-beta-mannosidase
MTGCGSVVLEATDHVDEVGMAPPGETFSVDGRFLHDRCGQRVVLRGVNEMIVWSDGQDGVPEFAEIAKTGANAVRVTWTSDAPASALDVAIANAASTGLIPLVELHDGQGDFSKLSQLVDHWVRADVLSVVQKHERLLLVGIGGGVGSVVARDAWVTGYASALARMRAAGIRAPIVIDAPGSGRDAQRIIDAGQAVIDSDPQRNVLFGFSLWSAQNITDAVERHFPAAAALELPVFVAELSGYSFEGCETTPLDTGAVLAAAREHQIGWFAWSWGAVPNARCSGLLDMTRDGTLAGLAGWGYDVALGDPNGISSTSVRPASVATGRCLGR